eukprot:c20276_g1_i1.p1 GENE.c20276_g1_i1~~c20276_g1_i1.p1  ORF type:complete len:364 (+),score=154.26 c20276_g1_i1:68-1159(+)
MKAGPRCLIILPVHELAKQTLREVERLADGTGLKTKLLANANMKSKEQRCDILIATPLRLVTALKEGLVALNLIKIVIFDEADKLFEMGFLEQVDEVLHHCSNPSLIRCLFSATIPKRVEELAQSILRNPLFIVCGKRNAAVSTVEQKLLFVGNENGKILAVRQLFQKGGLQPPILIFLQTKERAQELFKELVYDGINVDAIHADKSIAQRDEIVKNFRLGKIWVLITTDVLGRGIDFKGVNTVINFDFPNSITSYIHRIGRTGRAGRTGQAITLFTENEGDVTLLRGVANVIRASGGEVPEWMLKLKKANRIEQRKLSRVAPRRQSLSTLPKYIRKEHLKLRKEKKLKKKQLKSKQETTDES